MKYFGQYQDEIYLAGLRGIVPKLPIDIATLEKKQDAGRAPLHGICATHKFTLTVS